MKEQTDVTIILDRSGSKEAIKTDAIGGYNTFIEEQKKLGEKCLITLVQFDDQYERLYSTKFPSNVEALTTNTFVPRGTTALYDAIGRTVTDIGSRISALPENDRPNKVVVLIITDGQENCSREYNAARIKEMVEHQQSKYNWQFVFIGANQDAVLTASGLGISAANSLTMSYSAQGTADAFNSVASNVHNYATGMVAGAGFTCEQKKQQEDLINVLGK